MQNNRRLHQAAANSPPKQIFVTGLPKNFDLASVYSYFKQFGSIEVHPYKSQLKSIARSKEEINNKHFLGGEGYCLIRTFSSVTFDEIMKYSEHSVFGRCLGVTPFLTGQELTLHNINIANRKVIIKKVPSKISLSELKLALELSFGEVEKIFAFKNDRESKQTVRQAERKFRVYSVLFAKKSSARCISERGILVLPTGEALGVEKFRRSTPGEPNQRFQIRSSSESLGETSRTHPKTLNFSQSVNGSPTILLQEVKREEKVGLEKKEFRTNKIVVPSDPPGVQQSALNWRLSSKPTTRSYFEISRRVPTLMSDAPHLADRNDPRDTANLRFNILRCKNRVGSDALADRVDQNYQKPSCNLPMIKQSDFTKQPSKLRSRNNRSYVLL